MKNLFVVSICTLIVCLSRFIVPASNVTLRQYLNDPTCRLAIIVISVLVASGFMSIIKHIKEHRSKEDNR